MSSPVDKDLSILPPESAVLQLATKKGVAGELERRPAISVLQESRMAAERSGEPIGNPKTVTKEIAAEAKALV